MPAVETAPVIPTGDSLGNRLRTRREAERLLLEHWHLAAITAGRIFRGASPEEKADGEAVALRALWQAAQTFDPRAGRTSFASWSVILMRRALLTERQSQTRAVRGGGVRPLSLEVPIGNGGGDGRGDGRGEASILGDVLADPEALRPFRVLEGDDHATAIVAAVEDLVRTGTLSARAAEAFYGAARGETLAQTAARLGVSGGGAWKMRERVRRAVLPLFVNEPA